MREFLIALINRRRSLGCFVEIKKLRAICKSINLIKLWVNRKYLRFKGICSVSYNLKNRFRKLLGNFSLTERIPAFIESHLYLSLSARI